MKRKKEKKKLATLWNSAVREPKTHLEYIQIERDIIESMVKSFLNLAEFPTPLLTSVGQSLLASCN